MDTEREQISIPNDRTNLKIEPIDKSHSEALRIVEPTHQTPAKFSYDCFKHEAPEITGKDFSSQADSRDSKVIPKSTSAAIESPIEIGRNFLSKGNAKPEPTVHTMESSEEKSIVANETNDSTPNQPSIRPVKIALKLVSILLYCLIILLLSQEK